jgi:hypothetical protein
MKLLVVLINWSGHIIKYSLTAFFFTFFPIYRIQITQLYARKTFNRFIPSRMVSRKRPTPVFGKYSPQISARAPAVFTGVLRGFTQHYLQANSGILPRSGHDHFLQNAFQFTIHQSSYHSANNLEDPEGDAGIIIGRNSFVITIGAQSRLSPV